MTDQPDGMDLPPLNEWVVDQWTKDREALMEIMQRHAEIVNLLSDMAHKNDALREAGVELATFAHELVMILQNPEMQLDDLRRSVLIEDAYKAIDRWRNANV